VSTQQIEETKPKRRRKAEKSPFEKLPKRAQRVVLQARQGLRVCRRVTGEDETQYFYEPGGKAISPAAARRAIASGLLVPGGDGLFAGMDQTWTAAP
jgi:hypothetical protein